jgi:hypothetical protein
MKIMKDIYFVLDSWGLLKEDVNLKIYSNRELLQVGREIESCYSEASKQMLGRAHLGVTRSIRYVEGNELLSSIAVPLLTFNQIWLPDPIYSFFTRQSFEAWKLMPDSGSRFFTKQPSIHTAWTTYWGCSHENRNDYLLKTLPGILNRMKIIRPLVNDKVIFLWPWELLVNNCYKEMKESIQILEKSQIINVITKKYNQNEYNLGPRIGSIGVELSSNDSIHGLKAGTKMWLGDTIPVLVYGLLNTMVSEYFGANFISELPGDRIVHDFIRSGGNIEPPSMELGKHVALPRFTEAIWDDIIAIRKDSESLSLLRNIISDASNLDEEFSMESIKDRISDVINKINCEKSIWKVVKDGTSEVIIGAFGGFITMAVSGTTIPLSTVGAGAGSGLAFLWQLYKGLGNKNFREARKRVELYTKIIEKYK